MQRIYSFFKNYKRTSVALLVLVLLVALVLILFAISTAGLNTEKIYDGIYVGDLSVSGMTKEEASLAISEHYSPFLTKTILISCEGNQKELPLADIAGALDLDKTLQLAYETGRNGNVFKRLQKVRSFKQTPVKIAPYITCDETVLTAIFGELAALVDIPEQEMQITINENELIIARGKSGKRVLIPEAISSFKETALTLEDNTFTLALTEISATEPNAQEIYNNIGGDPVDASYAVENRKLVITPEKLGIQFDVQAAQTLIDETVGDEIVIPIESIAPAVTADQIQSSLFKDLLGTYTTSYNTGDVPRSHNVALASQKINDIVLAPGEVFSYNDIVGPRTTAHGFRVANVYVANKVEPGIGGGICQVSSTLFNAVVLSDLKIVYRKNHSLPVSYVPLGRDATVSYGSIDFKFMNDTDNLIRIVAQANRGRNTVSIYGVKKHQNRSIEITTQKTGSSAPRLIQKEDDTLPVGTVKVEQKGSYGSSHNTYKVIKENGKVVKSELLCKSVYIATEQIEIVGTKPEEAVDVGASPQPTFPAQPGILPPNAGVTDEPVIPVPTSVPTPSPVPMSTITPSPATEPAVAGDAQAE